MLLIWYKFRHIKHSNTILYKHFSIKSLCAFDTCWWYNKMAYNVKSLYFIALVCHLFLKSSFHICTPGIIIIIRDIKFNKIYIYMYIYIYIYIYMCACIDICDDSIGLTGKFVPILKENWNAEDLNFSTFIKLYRCHSVLQPFSIFQATWKFRPSRISQVFQRKTFLSDFLPRPKSWNFFH